MFNQLVHFGICCQMDNDVDRWVGGAADTTNKIAIRHTQVLQQGGEGIGPGVLTAIDPKDRMPHGHQCEAKIGADLATRTGNQYPHMPLTIRQKRAIDHAPIAPLLVLTPDS